MTARKYVLPTLVSAAAVTVVFVSALLLGRDHDRDKPGYVVFGIDSLSYCQAASRSGDLSAPYEAAALRQLGWGGENAGVPGQTVGEALSGAHGTRSLRRALLRAPSGQPNRWLVLIAGANDLNRDHQTASMLAKRVAALCHLAREGGWRVAVCTITPMSPRTIGLHVPYRHWEMERTNYNAWLRQHHGEIAERFVDLAADPHLMTPENRAYYSADGIHFTDAGYQIVGARVGEILTSEMSASGIETERKRS